MKRLDILSIVLLSTISYCYCNNERPQGAHTVSSVETRFSVSVINSDFIGIDSLLWDLKALSKVPEVYTIKEDRVRSFLYKGVDYNGRVTQVFAYYSNPDMLAGRTSEGKKYPGVILVHGGAGRAFKEWVEKWAADGYAAIAMDLSGNGETGEKLENGGPCLSEDNVFKRIEEGDLKNVWTYQAVSNVILAHSLLLSFPEVDTTKTCITGISYGGYITCIIAALDKRFKAAVPVYGCAYFDESDFFKEFLDHLSSENKRQWMKYFDPSVYLPFAKGQFLFVNGNKDRFFNVEPYQKTIRLLAQTQSTICIKPDMNHNYIEGWNSPEIKCFFESILNRGKPLLKIYKLSVGKSYVSVNCDSSRSIKSAVFYYSNDSVSSNLQRVWLMKKAKIYFLSGRIICKIRKKNFKYGFFHIEDNRGLAVSSEFVIN